MGIVRGSFTPPKANLTVIQTMFLCAGLGTRLLPLTRELPKPLVPLGDRPILLHLIAALEQAGGVLRAVNAHHLPTKIVEFIHGYDDRVHVSLEVELLGTAGGIRPALSAFQPAPLLIWNADTVTTPNVPGLVRGLDRAPLALSVQELAPGQGNVGLDEAGRIVRLRGLSIGVEATGGNYVGILAMRPDCFDLLPERGCLIGDVAMPMMRSRAGIVGVPHLTSWCDIGSLGAYLHENMRWLQERGSNQAFVDPSASVAPTVDFDRVIVGRGATIRGVGRLERVVVWPGATCVAPLSDAIVTPEAGVVPIRRDS
jgi:mannose-1-phosphate guanylyltransferase